MANLGENIQTINVQTIILPESKPNKKLTEYFCFQIPELKKAYVKLLNDNLVGLINHIYDNKNSETYSSAEIRVGLSMKMLMSSSSLISYQLSSLIAKDIEELRKDDNYTCKWESSSMKRKALLKELEFLRKHTEIDDTISLNLADESINPTLPNMKEYDIQSGISTLNVSIKYPLDKDLDQASNCSLC
jgi:hypothetical protein